MSRISEYLQQILSARYGRDVRQSIHDAIEEMDEIAEGAKDSAKAYADKVEEIAETLPGAIGINDETVSTMTTWSSEKIDGITEIDDSNISPNSTWSSEKISQSASGIDDTTTATDKTWSSEKINTEIQNKTIEVDADFSETSENPVQNKSITSKLLEAIFMTDPEEIETPEIRDAESVGGKYTAAMLDSKFEEIDTDVETLQNETSDLFQQIVWKKVEVSDFITTTLSLNTSSCAYANGNTMDLYLAINVTKAMSSGTLATFTKYIPKNAKLYRIAGCVDASGASKTEVFRFADGDLSCLASLPVNSAVYIHIVYAYQKIELN